MKKTLRSTGNNEKIAAHHSFLAAMKGNFHQMKVPTSWSPIVLSCPWMIDVGFVVFEAANSFDTSKNEVPSGKHTKSYWKWPFRVDLPIKNGDFP